MNLHIFKARGTEALYFAIPQYKNGYITVMLTDYYFILNT